MKYSIRISKVAAKELQSIPSKAGDKIIDAIYSLETNPRPPGHKKLKGQKQAVYRIRVGDYRVLYLIDDVIRIVDVHRVGHRRDVYE